MKVCIAEHESNYIQIFQKKHHKMPFLWYNFLMFKNGKLEKITGVAVPLGALYSKENPCIGEFKDLALFAEFCKTAGLSIIQLLPVNDTGTQSSPYSGLSAFALHPIYITVKDIPEFDALYKTDSDFKTDYDKFIKNTPYALRYDYDLILNTKISLLKKLYELTSEGKKGEVSEELSEWIKHNSWVKTYAVYKNLKWNYMQASWKTWLDTDRLKTKEEITALWNKKAFKKEHLFYAWIQMHAFCQFESAIKKVHELGIVVKGDMPILMNEDSCDAWAYPDYFTQSLRAGSPSDGENPDGQNWGFPIYNWKKLKDDNYSWWKNRLKLASRFYDAYRLDHILGFFRIWAIPEDDCNALNGHTEPYAAIKKTELYELGFDDDRIRWLSRPHIPTSAIQNITWNYENSHKILELFCNKLEGEELWLFKNSVKGSSDFWKADLSGLAEKETEHRVKQVLVSYWSNKALLEVDKNRFVPLWTYEQSTSWKSLNQKEKDLLCALFAELSKKNEKLWQKQASEIFDAIVKDNKMIPCGEDLGVGIKCVPEVMKEHDILGLRVVRWCRNWGEKDQPFVPFKEYEPLSVATTSVHDSSTIRQWWNDEKESIKSFIKENAADFIPENTGTNAGPLFELSDQELIQKTSELYKNEFTPELAQMILKASAKAQSLLFIPPLEDLLYMDKSLWLSRAEDERINIPGTVTKFNWTWRMPCSVEDLFRNKELIQKIAGIASLRNK